MKSLTREFLLMPEGDPERKVSKFFSNMEEEINSLCVNGDYQRDEAVGLHMRKLWKLNKAHERYEMTDDRGRRNAGDFKPAVPRATILREQFELQLKSFLLHIKFEGVTPQEEIARSLWDKFAREIGTFGKNISYFETGPNELQRETMDWFFSKVWHEIQDLSIAGGRGWQRAVALYFDELCRKNSLFGAAIGERRKFLGADKWKKSVGLIKRSAKPQLKVVEERLVTHSDESFEERGITRSKAGTILFGSAQNALSDYVSEGNSSEHASAVAKRAGRVNQITVGLYLKEETPPLKEEESAEIIAIREDSGGDDYDITGTSSSECGHKMDDDATEATIVDSFGADSINPSDGNSSCASTRSLGVTICGCNAKWATTVNGVQYYSCARPKSSLFLDIVDVNEDPSRSDGETTKERNRRLLLQDRTFRAGRRKIKNIKRLGRCSSHAQELQTVEEMDISVEGLPGVIDTTEEEESTTGSSLREIDIEVCRKIRSLGNAKRVRHPHRKKIKVRGPSVRGVTPGYWRFAAREFSYIIQLYSCSGARYAMFRSNRRYKPGD